MRGYYVPLAAGAMLAVSAFLPWMHLDDLPIGGVPDPGGLWILGLGLVAVLLAGLSLWTRKNSRHPLLLVGLAALAIMYLGYQWTARGIRDSAWARAQARAIVDNARVVNPPATEIGMGIYLGVAAAVVLVLFGLTIVIKRVPQAYAAPEDDDV